MPGLPGQEAKTGGRVVAFPAPPRLERARGVTKVAFAQRHRGTVVSDLFQSGCAKVLLPRREPGDRREAILVNTAGGLTDGDLLQQKVVWERGSDALVTSQAAERIYRSRGTTARIETRLSIGPDATALWLPQETILFNGARLSRTTKVEIAPSAHLIACEGLIFGRSAMGERLSEGEVSDSWRLRSGQRLLFADTFRLNGNIAECLSRPAVADGAGAVATVLYVGPEAEARLGVLRAVPTTCSSSRFACSRLGRVVVARMLATTGAELRRSVVAALTALQGGRRDMPRVWTC